MTDAGAPRQPAAANDVVKLGRKLDLSRAPDAGTPDGNYEWTLEEGLRFRLSFSHGRRALVDFAAVAIDRPGLAQDFASTLWNAHWAGSGLHSAALIEHAAGACRSFHRFLMEFDEERRITALVDVSRFLLTSYLDWLEHLQTPQRRRTVAQDLLRVLRLASGWIPVEPSVAGFRLPPDLWRRGGYEPREPYSAYVAQQLYAGARKDFEEAIDRLEVLGPELLRKGRDPRLEPDGWTHLENLLWYFANVGFARWRELKGAGYHVTASVTQASELLLPVTRDLLAFVIIMGLETGIPPESLNELAPECLTNPAGSFVDLLYRKSRAHDENLKSVGVRADLPFSPGWMVQKMSDLTKRARSLAQGREHDFLLLARRPRGPGVGLVGNTLLQLRQPENFCKRHGILNDDGSPLQTLQLSRLRKTRFSEQYRKFKGNIRATAAANSHSPKIAMARYARIAAHSEQHEASIRAGLDMALRAALSAADRRREADLAEMPIAPQVLGDEDVAALRDDPGRAAAELGVTESVATSLLDGEMDVWLAGCKDIAASPFGSPDGICRVPLWGCLSCRNAVVTSAKLPAILTLLEEILQARQRSDLATWASRFGALYMTIMKGVLPRFSQEQIMEARDSLRAHAVLPILSSIPFPLTRG